MSKHTPGPWMVARGYINRRPYAIFSATPRIGAINSVINWRGITKPATAESEANARLIAAAPELLDTLRWIDAWISNPVSAHSVHALDGLFLSTRDRINILIAKIEGDAP